MIHIITKYIYYYIIKLYRKSLGNLEENSLRYLSICSSQQIFTECLRHKKAQQGIGQTLLLGAPFRQTFQTHWWLELDLTTNMML